MFKFAAILLLFLVGHFDSAASLDEATWLEFNCKESQFDGLWRNNLRRLLVYNQRLYFLFENYAVRMELPDYYFKQTTYEINETAATSGRLDFLFFKTPQYLFYGKLGARPGLLGLNDATGHFLSRPQASEEVQDDKLFVIRESGFGEEYVMKFNQIQSGGNILFRMGTETQNEVMRQIVIKEKFQLGYTRQDTWKIMNVKYVLNRVDFVLLDGDGNFHSQSSLTDLKYRAERAVYYQIGDIGTDAPLLHNEDFVAFLFEIERNSTVGSMVHLHRFRFGPDFVQPNPTAYKILEHHDVRLSLAEFLDCPMQVVAVEQLKGSFFTQNERRKNEIHFYLFINDWYYRTSFNLFIVHFNLKTTLKWREHAQKIQLPDGTSYEQQPKEEKLTMKYIKQYEDAIWVTWNNQQTFQLNIENPGDWNEVLRVKEEKDSYWHRCAFQVFTVDTYKATFCFERQHYYYFTINDRWARDPVWKEEDITRYTIASIFEGSNLGDKWTHEDLQAIIPYNHWDPNHKHLEEEVIWLTYSWIYKFQNKFFMVIEPDLEHHPWNRKIVIDPNFRKNIPNFMAGKWPNCLFKADCESKAIIIDDDDDGYKKRDVKGVSWIAILLVLILILVLAFTIWIVIDVKVKTNVAFLDNLRTTIRKKIIYPPDSAEKGEHKPEELKSVKSTSSLGATTKRKSLQSLGEAKTSAAAKSDGSPKAKLTTKKSAEKLAGKKSAEKLSVKKSAEKLAVKKSAEKAVKK